MRIGWGSEARYRSAVVRWTRLVHSSHPLVMGGRRWTALSCDLPVPFFEPRSLGSGGVVALDSGSLVSGSGGL